MSSTEYVYICGAEYWRHLFLSMRSLFASGTSVDRLTVYVVGGGGDKWGIRHPNIRIRNVSNLNESYWYENKLHLCNSDADRVVFLDTDVIVMQPIETLFMSVDEDIVARPAVRTYMENWNPHRWESKLTAMNLPSTPLLSDGFMIFQNNSHKRIRNSWQEYIKIILSGESPLQASRFAELEAFSISVGSESLSLSLMPEYGHRYAMIGESPHDAVVYHLGTPAFYRYYLPLEKKLGLRKQRGLPVRRPRLLRLVAIAERIHHRIKKKIKGGRDKSLSW